MSITRKQFSFAISLLALGISQAEVVEKDICVYEGTAAGVHAARMGESVVLIEPGKHTGGMTLGEFVMTEHQLKGGPMAMDPVALGSYGMDSHPTQLWVDDDGALHADTPKWTGVSPYGISYKSLVPKVDQCSNLLVPVCLSASHSACGSLRMEPVYMMLGQAAATAVALAVDGSTTVQDVPYPKLREQLLKDGQILEPAAMKPKKQMRP